MNLIWGVQICYELESFSQIGQIGTNTDQNEFNQLSHTHTERRMPGRLAFFSSVGNL